MNFIILSLIALQLNVSCKKEPTLEPDCNSGSPTVELNKDFEVIWSKRSNNGFTCYSTVVTSTNVIYFLDPPDFSSSETIIALDKTNGDTLWIKKNQGSNRKQKLVNNNLYLDQNGLTCLDIVSGNEIWKIPNYSNKELSDFIYANNRIYAYYDLGGGIVGDSTKLYEIDPITGMSITKFTLYGADRNGYNQAPRGMVYYKHSNGNDIIFTQSTGYKPSITSERGEYYAIDITGDSMYWDLGRYLYDGTLNSGGGGGSNPFLIGNVIYINQGWIYNASLNIQNKTINWKTQVPTSYRTSVGVMFEMNGKIFQSLGNASNLNIINSIDGSFYKSLNNIGFDNWAANMKKYNNHAYITSTAGLYKIDVSGTIVKKALTSDLMAKDVGGSFQYLDIDNSTGYIYCTIGHNLVCIKEK